MAGFFSAFTRVPCDWAGFSSFPFLSRSGFDVNSPLDAGSYFLPLDFDLCFCFCFFLPFGSSLVDTGEGTGDSSAGRFLFSTDLSKALARSSAIFSASLLLMVLLSD